MHLQVKMQDLLKTDRIYSSKKDDAVSRDDDDDAAEPLAGPSASNGPPAVQHHDGVISPLVVDNSAVTAAKGPVPAAAADGPAPVEQLLLASTGQPLLRIPAVGLMFADTLYGAPTLLPELVNRWGAVHKILIIITIRQVPCPSLLPGVIVCLAGQDNVCHIPLSSWCTGEALLPASRCSLLSAYLGSAVLLV